MPQALPLPDKISDNSTKKVSARIIKSQFGEGYGQRAADGLNSKVTMISLSWIPLTKADALTVTTALDAVGGWDYFTWIPFFESVSKKFIVEGGTYEVRHVGIKTVISCSLIQIFDL